MKKIGLFIALIVGAVFVYSMISFPTAPPAPTPTPYCGDGNLDPGEFCDDGNNLDGDGCSANCTIEPYCGDGNLDPGEYCDDGNNIDGDGCSATCEIEPPPPMTDCTPGYWKNHLGDWWGMECGGAIDDDTLDDMLSPEDGGLGRVRANRELAAYLLNTCAPVVPNCD